jgi:hypothetical protein
MKGFGLIVHAIVLMSLVMIFSRFILVPLGLPVSNLNVEMAFGYVIFFLGLVFELGVVFVPFDLNVVGAIIFSGIITFVLFLIVSLLDL